MLKPTINTKQRRGRDKHGWTTIKPAKITVGLVKCGICHKTYNNPLTHVCSVNTMPQQKAAAKKREAARKKAEAARPRHEWAACKDKDCQRQSCLAFREGVEIGFDAGYEDGFDAGVASGSEEAA